MRQWRSSSSSSTAYHSMSCAGPGSQLRIDIRMYRECPRLPGFGLGNLTMASQCNGTRAGGVVPNLVLRN
jgi:hypothetical protein